MTDKKIVNKIEDNMDPQDVLCTTYQMRDIYQQFKDGYYQPHDVMNYIQHDICARYPSKDDVIVDVCCGRGLMLPLLRYYSDISKYYGVDISEKNLDEMTKKLATKKISPSNWKSYYDFDLYRIQCDVANMDDFIDEKIDGAIYTSALEHMHKNHGSDSLEACSSILKSDGWLMLSTPRTEGNGYDTQYSAHVYEWGIDELREKLNDVGFEIVNEFGILANVGPLKEAYKDEGLGEIFEVFNSYLSREWLTSTLAVPFPEYSKEVMLECRKM